MLLSRGLSPQLDLGYQDADIDNLVQACTRIRLHVERSLSGESTVGAGDVFDRLTRYTRSITHVLPFLTAVEESLSSIAGRAAGPGYIVVL